MKPKAKAKSFFDKQDIKWVTSKGNDGEDKDNSEDIESIDEMVKKGLVEVEILSDNYEDSSVETSYDIDDFEDE